MDHQERCLDGIQDQQGQNQDYHGLMEDYQVGNPILFYIMDSIIIIYCLTNHM